MRKIDFPWLAVGIYIGLFFGILMMTMHPPTQSTHRMLNLPKDQTRVVGTFAGGAFDCLIKAIDRSGKPAWMESECSR